MLQRMADPNKPRRRATYDDVLQAPEHKVAEIVDGELYLSPRPASRHALAEASLAMLLGPPFHYGRGGPGGWWIVMEPELHFGEDVLVPDLAGWRRERMPEFPKAAYFTLAPDWVCEVLSPSTTRLDRMKKMPVYAREGVSYLWLIDPIDQLIEMFQLLESKEWSFVGACGELDRVRASPFEAIELDLADLWGDTPATPTPDPTPTPAQGDAPDA
jgi:Uma2 family endonuclease